MTALGSIPNALLLAGIETPSTADTNRMTLLMGHASAAIRNYTRLNITSQTETVNLEGVWGSVLELPAWPVTDVDAVEVNGTVVPGWQFDDRRSLRRWGVEGDLWPLDHDDDTSPRRSQGATGRGPGGSWGGPGATVTVTYTNGWNPVPADIAAIAEAMSASAFSTPVGVRQEQIGSYSVTYAVEAIGASVRMAIHESTLLNRYRRRYA